MKHSFLLTLLAAASMMTSCTDKPDATIQANLPFTVKEPVEVALVNMDVEDDTVARAIITDSILNIPVAKVEKPFMARIVNLPVFNRIDLVVEPGVITIDKEGNAGGTVLNDRLKALNDEFENCETEEDYLVEIKKAYAENRDNTLGKFFYFYVIWYSEPTFAQAKAMLDTVPAEYRTAPRIVKLLKTLETAESTVAGSKFVDFTIERGGGAERLSDFVGRNGKYTLVDFWASWCGPCRREMPNLKALLQKYEAKLQIIGVAVWDEPDDTFKAIQELELPWHVMVGDKKLTEPADLYGVNGIPHIMLIDPQGIIVFRGLQGEELADAVANALK